MFIHREMQTQLASQTGILKEQEDELSALNQEHATVSIIYPLSTSICYCTLQLYERRGPHGAMFQVAKVI